MDDTISRRATLKHLKKRLIETAINNTGVTASCDSIFADTADNRIGTWINEVPSAQPERKRGRWQYWTESRVLCPFCKKEPFHGKGADKLRFCPHCGAEMDGKGGEQDG